MKSIRYYYSPDYKTCDVKFLTDANGNVLGPIKQDKPKSLPRFTICSIYDPETKLLSFGVSRCSENDLFLKKVGREKSYKRASENPSDVIKIEDKKKLGKIFIDHCLEIEDMYSGASTFKF